MEEEAEPELGKAYLLELAAVLLEIESLPLVTSVKLGGEPNDKPNNIKVYANVKAEFVTPPKSKQPKVCCSKQLPTQLDAARALLANLRKSEKGGYAEELAAAAAAAMEAAAAGGSSTTEHSHGISTARQGSHACLASRLPVLRLARDPFSNGDSRPARAATAASMLLTACVRMHVHRWLIIDGARALCL